MTKKIAYRRNAFTLVEMLVVLVIILVIAALAAAFAPRVADSTNLSRAVDNLEQWLLSAKMRAKRDGLATGIRFVQVQGDAPGFYSQIQYIQQPDPLTGGWLSNSQAPTGSSAPAPPPLPSSLFINGSILLPTPNTATMTPPPTTYPCPNTLNPPLVQVSPGQVQLYNFDASLGGTPSPSQWLVQAGDFLEVRDGGVYIIAGVGAVSTTTTANPPPPWTIPWPLLGVAVTTLQLGGSAYDTTLNLTSPTTNFRILRQPRILIGEEPLSLPNNYAVDLTAASGSNVQLGPSGNPEILFSPSGAVIGANAANGITGFIVYDTTMDPYDINRAGLIAVQTRTGFIGAYNVGPAGNTFLYVQLSRESGL